MLIALTGLFFLTAMQVAVVLLMHVGNADPRRSKGCYLIATLLGFASAAVMVVVFSHMNASLAIGIAVGAPFVCGQLCLAHVTRSRLSSRRWAGMACLTTGLFMLAYYQ
jgi:multidrug transporter EmrE-like cation transporter